LGWDILIFRQAGGGASPATKDSAPGTGLAEWSAGSGGLSWLFEMSRNGEALACNDSPGYPYRFTAQAENLTAYIVYQPPSVKGGNIQTMVVESPNDQLPRFRSEERAFINQTALAACDPDEWLVVEAWDQS
jgi:hypothetical protein